MENTTGTKLLLHPQEAAQALAISPRTLWTLTQRGEIACVRIGRSVRYSQADIKAYIQQNRRESPNAI